MLIKTLLNKVERFKSFIYGTASVMHIDGGEALVIDIEPRRNSQPICPECHKRRSAYDRQPSRLFEYLPVWTFKVYFRYAPRRVSCPIHGVKVEALPWGYGKERMTYSYQVYLARWAKRLSWQETADIFVGKMPMNCMIEFTELHPKTIYDKIDFIYKQCQKFVANRERKLLMGKKLPELEISCDRQEYVINWTNQFDKRNIRLLAIGSADNKSSYVLAYISILTQS